MPRALRHQYPGAVYHVMARGDGGKMLFEDDEDGKAFLYRLGQVCQSHGWLVHAWVLMGNHFHLLLETPEPNLVTGMKYLLGTFSQGWNGRRMRKGHVFQGRYKSVPVSAAVESPYYFRIVADYIHLNPARAGLASGSKGKLAAYKWSSLKAYATGKKPEWLVMERLLAAFELSKDGRGRRAYISWLEARASNDGGKVDEAAMKALRKGWYLGEPSFADKLHSLLDGRGKVEKIGWDRVARSHDEAEAEKITKQALEKVALPIETEKLSLLRKGDERKILIAIVVRKHTSASNRWLAERLAMGHPAGVSRLITTWKQNGAGLKALKDLEEMLQ